MPVRSWRLPSICLLVFALVASQALGLLHGIVHSHATPDAHRVAAAVADEAARDHWTTHLFGDHAGGSADCVLLAHGLASDLLSAPPLAALPPAAPVASVPPVQAYWASARDAQYLARGPPA